MITRKVLDSMTVDHGTRSGVIYRPIRTRSGGTFWKKVIVSDTHCSGCLKRHDPIDCPHKG